MNPSKRTIRASELGTFLYCQRAWWYQRKKIVAMNIEALTAGENYHNLHVSQSRTARILKVLAWLSAIIFIIILVILVVFR